MENLRDAILRNSLEISSILNGKMIDRDMEVDRKAMLAGMIEVITGPRRAGKSVFALQSVRNERFAYLNFDDETLVKAKDYNEFLRYASEIYGNFSFMVLDEIQNLNEWELFVNRLQRSNYRIVVTGSNSKLLSGELASHLTGRHMENVLLTFSFKEFLRAKGKTADSYYGRITDEKRGEMLSLLREYLVAGGYPELITKGIDRKGYVTTLIDSTILNDIAARNRVANPAVVISLIKYLFDIYTNEFTYNSIKNAIGLGSVHTAEKYTYYAEEAFLLFTISRFSDKATERPRSSRKVYVIDNAIASVYSFRFSEDIGKLMENAVAIELFRRYGRKIKFSVFYWKSQNSEVDFLIKDGNTVKELVQVTYASSENEVKERETNGLVRAAIATGCNDLKVITWDFEGGKVIDNWKISFVPLWQWLIH
jgi:hypothetical protein